jgi:hypothetical protein
LNRVNVSTSHLTSHFPGTFERTKEIRASSWSPRIPQESL